MAIRNLLAINNAVKMDGFSFFSDKPNHFLARRLSLTTPYVTGKREGKVLETPLCIGENIASNLNIETEKKLASEAVKKFHGSEEIKKLKELGIERNKVKNFLFGELMDFSRQHLCDSPLTTTVIDLEVMRKIDLELMKFHSSLKGFTSSVSNTIAKQEREMKNGGGGGEPHTTLSIKGKRKLNYFVSLARTYQPYTFFQARFDDTNTRNLIQDMSMEERKMFEFDGRRIDWEHYIVNVHLPGLKRELLRQRSS
ncbi:hypothetical protein EUTSA_v10028176mg [Eutrema salsugineum]|uniref:Fatty acyl-CoA reductase C-terminal domain-containing protein n=1 Tax=Eutrema salsugineum TaxID=72664 RepID=V4M3V5_EUTSA|nr:hypothetical protein EUTSA_v10028176mg [Eutrema salsugineum]